MTDWQLYGFDELRELGAGGAGRVVLARHQSTGTLVAIKYLATWLVSSTDRLASFRAEAELMAGLSDAHLVALYEYVESGIGAAIVMELVNGVSLRRMLDDGGRLPPEGALTLLKGSLLGLAALHSRALVHRDYKPENVMVDASGASKLVDYGIAAPVGGVTDIAGTPLYMAPEQWFGEPCTPAADVYAATATYVECLTGHSVFEPTSMDALRVQHLVREADLEDVPRALRPTVRAGLAKDPANRMADAALFIERLEASALADYGRHWEERGRQQLARRAALLALLFPLHQFAAGAVTDASTTLTTSTDVEVAGRRPERASQSERAGSGAQVAGAAGGWLGLEGNGADSREPYRLVRRPANRKPCWLLPAAALLVLVGAAAGALNRAANSSTQSQAGTYTEVSDSAVDAQQRRPASSFPPSVEPTSSGPSAATPSAQASTAAGPTTAPEGLPKPGASPAPTAALPSPAGGSTGPTIQQRSPIQLPPPSAPAEPTPPLASTLLPPTGPPLEIPGTPSEEISPPPEPIP